MILPRVSYDFGLNNGSFSAVFFFEIEFDTFFYV